MYICMHVTFFFSITEILRPSSKETLSGKTAILFFFCNSRADRNSEAFEKTFINWEVRFSIFVTGIFFFSLLYSPVFFCIFFCCFFIVCNEAFPNKWMYVCRAMRTWIMKPQMICSTNAEGFPRRDDGGHT